MHCVAVGGGQNTLHPHLSKHTWMYIYFIKEYITFYKFMIILSDNMSGILDRIAANNMKHIMLCTLKWHFNSSWSSSTIHAIAACNLKFKLFFICPSLGWLPPSASPLFSMEISLLLWISDIFMWFFIWMNEYEKKNHPMIVILCHRTFYLRTAIRMEDQEHRQCHTTSSPSFSFDWLCVWNE